MWQAGWRWWPFHLFARARTYIYTHTDTYTHIQTHTIGSIDSVIKRCEVSAVSEVDRHREEVFGSDRSHHHHHHHHHHHYHHHHLIIIIIIMIIIMSSLKSHKYVDSPASIPVVSLGKRRDIKDEIIANH
jgi:hypothetical protein